MRVSKLCLLAFASAAACYHDEPHQDEPHQELCWDSRSCRPIHYQPALPDARDPNESLACPVERIDPLRSLVIHQPGVLRELQSESKAGGPWGFGARVTSLVASTAGAQQLLANWFNQFANDQEVPAVLDAPYGPYVTVPARPDVHAVLQCPWLKLDVNNQCTFDCASCAGRKLNLERSPFVLLAIVNRMDLAQDASPCSQDGGELRLVYTAVESNSGRALPLTVIFEYKVTLADGQDRRWYAQQWQQLSSGAEAAMSARLQAWLLPVLRGATLARVRTNEDAFGRSEGLPWELRQFEPVKVGTDQARLVQTRVPHTPRFEMNNTPQLATLIEKERAQIIDGDNRLPSTWIAGSAVLPGANFAWQAAGTDPLVRQGFNRNTCNGCHGGFAGSAIGFQHIGPANANNVAMLPAQLSRFLHDPTAPDDELRRRKVKLEQSLCGSCQVRLPNSADAGANQDCMIGSPN